MGWRSPEKMLEYNANKCAKRLARNMEHGFKKPIGPPRAPKVRRRKMTYEEFLAKRAVLNKNYRSRKALAELAETRRKRAA